MAVRCACQIILGISDEILKTRVGANFSTKGALNNYQATSCMLSQD